MNETPPHQDDTTRRADVLDGSLESNSGEAGGDEELHPAIVRDRLARQRHLKQENFSLASLFLLMVLVAALLGFVANALPGRTAPAEPENLNRRYYRSRFEIPKEAVFVFGGVVLGIVGMALGGWTGFQMKRRVTGTLLGMFYGTLAAVVPSVVLFYLPAWPMVLVSCAMLIGLGLLLGRKNRQPSDP